MEPKDSKVGNSESAKERAKTALSHAFEIMSSNIKVVMDYNERERELAARTVENLSKEKLTSLLKDIYSRATPILKWFANYYKEWKPMCHLLQGGGVDEEEWVKPSPPSSILEILRNTNKEDASNAYYACRFALLGESKGAHRVGTPSLLGVYLLFKRLIEGFDYTEMILAKKCYEIEWAKLEDSLWKLLLEVHNYKNTQGGNR